MLAGSSVMLWLKEQCFDRGVYGLESVGSTMVTTSEVATQSQSHQSAQSWNSWVGYASGELEDLGSKNINKTATVARTRTRTKINMRQSFS